MSERLGPEISVVRRFAARLRGLATRDVFPEFSAHVRRRLYHPLAVLTFAGLAALLCGLFLHPQGFVLFGGIAAVIGLGIVWPWLGLRGVRGAITFGGTGRRANGPSHAHVAACVGGVGPGGARQVRGRGRL